MIIELQWLLDINGELIMRETGVTNHLQVTFWNQKIRFDLSQFIGLNKCLLFSGLDLALSWQTVRHAYTRDVYKLLYLRSLKKTYIIPPLWNKHKLYYPPRVSFNHPSWVTQIAGGSWTTK
jgi:hypothetical protein